MPTVGAKGRLTAWHSRGAGDLVDVNRSKNRPASVGQMRKSVSLRSLDRVTDHLVELLRLRGEGLQLVLSKPRLKAQDFL
jgi:hypothetical protein